MIKIIKILDYYEIHGSTRYMMLPVSMSHYYMSLDSIRIFPPSRPPLSIALRRCLVM